MIGKFVTKVIQSLPSWEVTKYYGRVCIYQLKCFKYKVQTSEAWFNFKCKFMPGSLRNELECEEVVQPKSMYILQQGVPTCSLQEPQGSTATMKSKSKDDKVKKKAKDRSLKTETCQKKQVDTKKEDRESLDSYVNEEKLSQEDYSRKKQRKMKQAR